MFSKSITRIAQKKTSITILMVILIMLAFLNRFIQDDAFISFRYARNLAEGHGLVWNPGEKPVEGYTNFLWTVIMVVPHVIGMDAIVFSWLLGLLFYGGTLVMSWSLSMVLFKSKALSLLTLLLLGTNYTFSCYATGGLETQMQTFLITAVTYLSLVIVMNGRWSPIGLTGLSLIASAAVLTRPDSVVPLAAIAFFILGTIIKGTIAPPRKALYLTCLLVPGASILASYGIWKLSYYGTLIPNTFHAKVSSVASLEQGIRYILLFFQSYRLIPFIFLIPFLGRQLLQKTRFLIFPGSIIILWLLYIASVGGDFMEFRFMVPVLPLMFILISSVVFVIRQQAIRSALVLMICAGSLVHAVTFHYTSGIESIGSLQSHLTADHENWILIGKKLKDFFAGCEKEVTLATTAIGAIGYYSTLRIIDMHGLTDEYIARRGKIIDSRPGHSKLAPLSYLKKQNTTLVLGHPDLLQSSKDASRGSCNSPSASDLIKYPIDNNAPIVRIPITDQRVLKALYLDTNRCVEKVSD
ncbi:MAG: hypothetical protein GF401_15685 [Chitinivibrionales bacterium]|nr:hypothetical protein [Chitinivibrionales bacterium]